MAWFHYKNKDCFDPCNGKFGLANMEKAGLGPRAETRVPKT